MTTISGTPDVDVELTGPGSTFRVKPTPASVAVLAAEAVGNITLAPQGGIVVVDGNVSFSHPSGSSLSSTNELKIESPRVLVGNGAKFWEARHEPATAEMILEAGDFATLRGAAVHLDGGTLQDPFGELVRVRQNLAAPTPPEDRIRLSTRPTGRPTDGEVVIESGKTTNGWDMWIEARTNTGTPTQLALSGNILLSGPARTTGDASFEGAVDVIGSTSLQDSLDVLGDVIISKAQPILTLDDTSTSIAYRLESGSELKFVREDTSTSVSTELLALQRTESTLAGTTTYVTTLRGPSPASGGDSEEGRIAFGDRATLLAQDGIAEVIAPNASLTLTKEVIGLAEATLTAGDIFAPSAFNQVTLASASNGVLRFGRFNVGGGPPTFEDRLRMDTDGRLRLFDTLNTASPGVSPTLDFDPTVGNDAILNVGQGLGTVGSQRGQVVARRGASTAPGLLVLEADDGTPVYLAAWAVGANIQVEASLAVPTGPNSGPVLVTL